MVESAPVDAGWPSRIRRVRATLRLSWAELADRLGVSAHTRRPSRRALRALERLERDAARYASGRGWGRRLRALRAATPLRTQRRMAARLGVPFWTYVAWDRGWNAPNLYYRARIEPTLAYLERLIAEWDARWRPGGDADEAPSQDDVA